MQQHVIKSQQPPKTVEKKQVKKKKVFNNSITKKVNPSYKTIPFKKEAIKDITYLLNEGYKNSYTTSSLKEELRGVLEKHNHSNDLYLAGYINYFVRAGMLEHQKGSRVYKVNRTNLLPKRKKEQDLGILDELGMS